MRRAERAVSDPAIAILPYGHRQGRALADTPLSDLNWPLGRPERLGQGRLRDMGPADHLIVYPKTTSHIDLRRGIRAQVSIMVVEPAIIHARHLRLLRLTHRRFFRVLSFNRALLSRIPNGLFLPYGTTWVPDWRERATDKSAMCSLIASAKRDSAGHQLRHRIVDHIRATGRDVAVMGGGYAPFERKADGLAPYRYSVVIENVREPDYFSEKLIDALLCLTVPIYWGCPNVHDYFDTAGMVICRNAAEIEAALATMSEADYAARLPALKAARPVADSFTDLERRAAETLRDSL